MRTRKLFIPLLVVLVLAGCSAASWFKVIGDLLPLAAQVATQFYAFANKGEIDAGDQQLIAAYTSDAKNILSTIQNAVNAVSANGEISTAQKVDALLKQLQNDSNTLLASLHIKDANTVAFINALLSDAVDLAGLVPVVSPGPITQAKVQSAQVQIHQSLPKAKSLQNVFQARLDSLPK